MRKNICITQLIYGNPYVIDAFSCVHFSHSQAARQYYCSISLHYIDHNWTLHSPLIRCTHVKGTHKKDKIGKLVAECIIPFLGEGAKIHSGVTDGGELASVRSTAAELGVNHTVQRTVEERYCVCHQLNLVVKKFLSDYFGTVCLYSHSDSDSYPLVDLHCLMASLYYTLEFFQSVQ